VDERSLQIENLEIRIRMLRDEQHGLFLAGADETASEENRKKAYKEAAALSLEILKVVREVRELGGK